MQLSPYFRQVIGTDPSEAQILEAKKALQNSSITNVVYEISPAETSPCENESVSLISVAQAIHWFDHPRFFQEAFRILKPGGAFVAWGYGHHSVNGCEEILERFYREVVGPYWPPERESIENRYKDIECPPWIRQNEIAPPDIRMEANWSRDQLLGYISTWSAIEKFRKAKKADPVRLLEISLEECWSDATEVRPIRWPIFFIAARKPAAS